MNKHRRRNLQIMLEDWAKWDDDLNAYPSSTPESRTGEGRAPGKPLSRPPKGVQVPEYILRVDRAVRAMGDISPDYKVAIEVRYRVDEDQRIREWWRRSRKSEGTYFRRVDAAHAWLDARLLG